MGDSGDEIDQTIIINDLLSFVWCKLRVCNKLKVLKAIEEFYSKQEAKDALRTLLSAMSADHDALIHNILQKYSNPFVKIVKILVSTDAKDVLVFVCKNLNNIPKLDIPLKPENVAEVEASEEFMEDHQTVRSQLTKVSESLHELEKSFRFLTGEILAPESQPEERDRGESVLSFDGILMKEESMEKANEHGRDEDKEKGQSEDEETEENEECNVSEAENEDMESESHITGSRFEQERPLKKMVKMTSLKRTSALFSEKDDSDPDWTDKYSQSELDSSDEDEEPPAKIRKKSYSPQLSLSKREQQEAMDLLSYHCDECNSKIATQMAFERHLRQHVDEEGYPCPLCAEKFPCERWKEHVRVCVQDSATDIDDIYCYVCDVFYADRHALKIHASFHDADKPFQCVVCEYMFTTQASLRKHQKSHEINKNGYKCPFCEHLSTRMHRAMEHLRSHTGHRPYKCPKCDMSHRSEIVLRSHLISHYPKAKRGAVWKSLFQRSKGQLEKPEAKPRKPRVKSQNQVVRPRKRGRQLKNTPVKSENSQNDSSSTKRRRKRIYQCIMCSLTFVGKLNLEEHIETHLGNGYQCPLCFSRYPAKEWQEHVRSCVERGGVLKENYYCKVCDVFYCDKQTLCYHTAQHSLSRTFVCSICDYRFYTQKTLEDHKRSHNSEAHFKCPFCNYRCFRKLKLIEHTRCHTGDAPYKCSECEAQFRSYGRHQLHLECHFNRSLSCKLCGKLFKSRRFLVSHWKCHRAEKPFNCPVCGKGFSVAHYMTAHYNAHFGKKKTVNTHFCPLCPYETNADHKLEYHMNTHTNAKPFKCPKCDFRANHKSYLAWHRKYYHPEMKHDRDYKKVFKDAFE